MRRLLNERKRKLAKDRQDEQRQLPCRGGGYYLAGPRTRLTDAACPPDLRPRILKTARAKAATPRERLAGLFHLTPLMATVRNRSRNGTA